MRYGVIVCPKCGMARGVEANKKSTTCPCGREIKLTRAKLRYLTDSPQELARTVADVNAALRGGRPAPPEKRRAARKGTYSEISERTRGIRDPLDRIRSIACELTALKPGGFTFEDLRKVASLVGRESAEEMLLRLREQSLVYEVEEGVFRAV